MSDDHLIRLEDGGLLLAEATVSGVDQNGVVLADVHVEPGHLPPQIRRDLVDAICRYADDTHARHLRAAVPRGDAELIQHICGHLSKVQLRAAGATSLVEGDVVRP